MKKTIKVLELIEYTNEVLSNNYSTKEDRNAIINFTSSLLQREGVYSGFNYLTSRELPEGIKVGMNGIYDNYEANFKDTDNTRIKFY